MAQSSSCPKLVTELQAVPIQDGELVVYGCASGRAPNFAWQSWVFEGLRVRAGDPALGFAAGETRLQLPIR